MVKSKLKRKSQKYWVKNNKWLTASKELEVNKLTELIK